jgi:hypothetical protein
MTGAIWVHRIAASSVPVREETLAVTVPEKYSGTVPGGKGTTTIHGTV